MEPKRTYFNFTPPSTTPRSSIWAVFFRYSDVNSILIEATRANAFLPDTVNEFLSPYFQHTYTTILLLRLSVFRKFSDDARNLPLKSYDRCVMNARGSAEWILLTSSTQS